MPTRSCTQPAERRATGRRSTTRRSASRSAGWVDPLGQQVDHHREYRKVHGGRLYHRIVAAIDCQETSRPSPGMERTPRSGMSRRSGTATARHVGEDRDHRVAHDVLEDHPGLRQAFGARRAHVILADLVEEESAVQPHLRAQGSPARRDTPAGRVDRRFVQTESAPALNRKPAEQETEQPLADDDVDQERDRHRDRRRHHDQPVGERTADIGHSERDRHRPAPK